VLNRISRRTFLLGATSLASSTAFASLGVGLYEPQQIKVEHVEIRLRRLAPEFDGLRVAQLSDIHFSRYLREAHLRSIVETTRAQRPDLVVLTGDFVTGFPFGGSRDERAEHAWPCAEVLRTLRPPLGTVAVLGNHDCDTNPEIVAEALAENKIQVLRNRSLALQRDGARLWLAGVDDVVAGYARPELALRGVPAEECVLALVHEPDFADEMRKFPVDLQLSGHSHGGQVRLPAAGALYLPELGRKYPLGHYHFGAFQLYTNRGVGVVGIPVRFMCTPELTVFKLRSDRRAA
jgi:hypothetical protein